MKTHASLSIFIIAITALIFTGTAVQADPLPGQLLKFSQLPQDGVVIYNQPYYGHDELSTIYGDRLEDGTTQPGFFGQEGVYMADDFADHFDTPVVHVRWWGSYMNQNQTGVNGVQQFLISFEKDVPAKLNADGTVLVPSHPDFNNDTNVHQIVNLDPDSALSPGEGTYLEKMITDSTTTPGALEDLYEYNAELAVPFEQIAGEVYWLKIVALVDDSKDNIHVAGENDSIIRWGWHNRDYTREDTLAIHPPALLPGEDIVGGFPGGSPDGDDVPIWHFQDNAVQGQLDLVELIPPNVGMVYQNESMWGPTHYQELTDGPSGISEYSKDLAFQLYTIPEPSSAVLMLGALLFGAFTCRRRS